MPDRARERRSHEQSDASAEGGEAHDDAPPHPPFRIVAFLAVLIPLAVLFLLFAAYVPQPTASAAESGYALAPPPPATAEIVYMGIEPIQINSISLQDGTFQTSFYVWWRWHGPIDPCLTTDILNSTASSSNYVTLYSYTNAAGIETPIRLAHGTKYQSAKVSVGIADPFSMGRYPLDSQDLSIRVENNTYDFDQMVYVADTANMSKHPGLEVAGWNLTSTGLSQYVHQYATNFGTLDQTAGNSRYSQLRFDVEVKRPFSHFLMKLFLPLFAVLLAGISALFVKAEDFDVRLAMAGTGLLTLIFLQQGYAGDLPATAPVVLMDEIYAFAYVTVGLTFLRVVYTTTRIHHGGLVAAFARTDRRIATIMAIGFLVGSALVVGL